MVFDVWPRIPTLLTYIFQGWLYAIFCGPAERVHNEPSSFPAGFIFRETSTDFIMPTTSTLAYI